MITKDYMVIDIETRPAEDSGNFKPSFSAPGNYTNPEKIAEAVASKEAEWISRTPLDPLTGEIIAIGCAMKYVESSSLTISISIEAEEKNMLIKFWERFAKFDGFIVGHNISDFDLPYLYLRSLKHDLNPYWNPHEKNYNERIIDTMQLWNARRYPKRLVSLGNLAKYFGIGSKEVSGADFHKWSINDQYQYLTNDLNLTNEVFKKFRLNL